MRTTIDVDRKLLEGARTLSGEKTLGGVVEQALREFVGRHAVHDLLALGKAGAITFEGDWKEMKHRDAKAYARREAVIDRAARGSR